MKKMIGVMMLFVACGFGICAGELNSSDQKKYASAVAFCSENALTQDNVWIYAKKAVFEANPQTFQALVSVVENVLSPVFPNESQKKGEIEACVSNFCVWSFDGKFAAEGYARAKAAGANVTRYAIHAKKLGLSEKEEFSLWVEFFCTLTSGDTWVWKFHQKRFVEILNKQSEAEAKVALKKINRYLSPKLLDDKATWEPTVAGIRTLLETY